MLAPVAAAQRAALVPPRVVHAPEVPSPPDGDGDEARVRLRITVDATGRVVDAEVLEAPPEPRGAPFVRAALDYVRGIELAPATRDGVPIPATLPFDVAFPPLARGTGPDATSLASGTGPDATPPASETGPDATPPAEDEEGFSARARVEGTMPAAASDFELDPGLLRAVPRRAADELLTLAPGLALGNHSGEGHASTVFLRGFDAGEGQDLEVLVEGVPINEPSSAHGHGYADASFLIPEAVRSVRVLEGPFDPRQGDFAVAGSAEYRLGVAERGLRVHGEFGSFDEKRLLLLWAPEGAREGTFAGVDLRDGEGFGRNRSHSRVSALAQWAEDAGPLAWNVLLATHAQRFDSPGIVREDACDGDPVLCLDDPNQGGSGSRHLVAARIAHHAGARTLAQSAWLQLRRTRFRENFTGALLDPRGDGLDEHYDATTVGARGSLRLQTGGPLALLEVGYVARHDEGTTRAWRLRRTGGAPYAVLFDEELAITQVGAYAAADLRPVDRLSIRGGLRLDAFGFSIVDRAGAEADRMGERLPTLATDAFGFAIEPRGTVSLQLVRGLAWITSAGLGARSSDAPALSEGEQAPFTEVVALETGLALRRDADPGLDLRAAAFYTRVGDDLVFDPERSRNVPVGASVRYGAFGAGRLSLGGWLDVLASATWSEARTPPEGASWLDLAAGDRLPFVPRLVGRLDAAARRSLPILGEPVTGTVAVGAGWIGRRPLPLGQLGDHTVTVDAAASVRVRGVEIGLLVENLLDARNAAAELHHASHFGDAGDPVSLVAARHFAAAPPRTVLGTLTLHLDAEWITGGDR